VNTESTIKPNQTNNPAFLVRALPNLRCLDSLLLLVASLIFLQSIDKASTDLLLDIKGIGQLCGAFNSIDL